MVNNELTKIETRMIPRDWEDKFLGDIGKIKMCRRIFNYQTKEMGAIPFFKIGTFGKEADAYISEDLYNNYRKKYSYPRKGDILISAAGTIGRTVKYDGAPSYYQDSNIVWIDNNEKLVTNGYLYYVLQEIKYNTEGGTIQRLYNSIIKSSKFIRPPLSEQTCIVKTLTDIDSLITSLQKLINKKKKIKIGTMQNLLTRKIRLSGFDEEWEMVKIKSIGNIITGGTPSTFIKTFWNGTIPWITPTDISEQKNTYTSERLITKQGLDLLRELPANSLLITCIASIGKNTILKVSGACNQQINAIVPSSSFDVDFLYYLLEHNKGYLLSKAGTTATMIISKNDFEEMEFRMPRDKQEQQAIANILSTLDNEIDALSEKLSKIKNLKQGAMQQLLTGKIRLI